MHPPRLLYPLVLLTLALLLAWPATSRGQDAWNTYQDTDLRLRYEHGTWQTFPVAAALGGTLTGTADPGATLTAYFEGTAVQLVYSLGPEGRTFSAQVDGGPLSTVYSYGDRYSHGHTLVFSDLPAGVHVLTVTNGNGAIWIEAVQVRGELLAPPATTAEEKIGSIAEEFPGFTLFFADDFDSGAASEWRNSQTDVNTLLIPHDDGQALRVAGDAWPVHAFVGALGDQVLQMRVLVESGTARLAAKVSDTGAYVIALDQAGTLRLDYGQVTLATAQTTVPPGTWLTLRIAIIGDTVTIWVDGYQALHFATNSTLLPGFFSVLPDGENSAAFQVDDLEVWIPAPTLPVAAVSLASPLTYVPEDLGLGTTSRMAHIGGSTLHVNNVPVTDWSSLAGPEWSPDGHQIVMLLSTPLTLRILNADGTRQRDIRVRITDVPYPDRLDYLLDPAWSPDGTKIAFRMVSTQGVNRIYYLDADCAQELCDATRLTNGTTSESYPTWSPDSTSLAYCTSWVVWDGQHFVTLSTIRMVTLTNPNPVELVAPSTDYYRDLDWAPDANWLALSLRRATDLKYVIARLDMASGTMTQYTDPVSPYGDYNPTVSPDGTMIAFQRASSPEWYGDLYVVPADAPLTEAPVSQYTNLRSPDWGTVLPQPIDFTNIRFNGAHAPLKSFMFWLMWNELSEDRFYFGGDAQIGTVDSPITDQRDQISRQLASFLIDTPYCANGINQASGEQPGTLNWDGNVVRIEHCEDHRYMMAQVLINAFIDYERTITWYDPDIPEQLMAAIYPYGYINFGGSIGSGRNGLWQGYRSCKDSGYFGDWPKTLISHDGTVTYLFSTYQEILEKMDKINERIMECGTGSECLASFPHRWQVQALAMMWLNEYFYCYSNIVPENDPYWIHFQDASPRIIAQIDRAIDDFYAQKPDPTGGAWGRLYANRLPTDSPHTIPLVTSSLGLDNSQADVKNLYDGRPGRTGVCPLTKNEILNYIYSPEMDHIDQVRDCYSPINPVVLQPLLWLDVSDPKTQAPAGYRWATASYVRLPGEHLQRYVDICATYGRCPDGQSQ